MRAVLDGLAGILGVEVDLSRDAFTVSYDTTEVSDSDIKRVIAYLGYNPRVAELKDLATTTERKSNTAVPEPVASALAEARKTSRLVFVDFYAEWCAPCKVLEEKVIPDPQVQRALESFVFLKLDTDHFPEAGIYYQVAAMPTLLVLDGTGAELHRFVGIIETQELAELLLKISQPPVDE